MKKNLMMTVALSALLSGGMAQASAFNALQNLSMLAVTSRLIGQELRQYVQDARAKLTEAKSMDLGSAKEALLQEGVASLGRAAGKIKEVLNDQFYEGIVRELNAKQAAKLQPLMDQVVEYTGLFEILSEAISSSPTE